MNHELIKLYLEFWNYIRQKINKKKKQFYDSDELIQLNDFIILILLHETATWRFGITIGEMAKP